MYLRVNLIFWALLTFSCSPTFTLDDKDWNKILPDLNTLCPNVNFCEKDQRAVGLQSNGENICCRGCSCASNCSKTRDCCDGTGDVDLLSECLVPSTNQNLDINMYDFVVKPPADGCKNVKGQDQVGSVTCNVKEMAYPWMDFFPVYSRSLDRNFKNSQCARCHGAADIETWTAIFYIDYAVDFSGILADFIENNILSDGYIVFRPPNAESSRFEKLCFREIGFCPSYASDSFYATPNVQLDRESIINACEQGPFAKYLSSHGRAFKNVFCAICNGYSRKSNNKLICENAIHYDKEIYPLIRVLLDTSYIASSETKAALWRKENGMCYRPIHSKNDSTCANLHCPSMQTRLPTGKCRYVAKVVSVQNLVLCLNVSTDYVKDKNYLNKLHGAQVLSMFEEQSPWSKNWFITVVGLLISERQGGLEFLVCLQMKMNQTNMETLQLEIKSILSKKWRVNFNPHIVFDQTITKHGKTGFGEIASAYWATFKSNFTADLKSPAWKLIYVLGSGLRSLLYYNQMFMCEQIQLNRDEYRQNSPLSVLYLQNTHNYLYPNQFTALVDADGSWRVRVCLKDSGYVKIGSNAETSKKTLFKVFRMFIIYKIISLAFGIA